MYNTNYECRYHKDEVFLETDIVTDEEKEFIRNVLYKEDLLNIFFIKEDDIFNDFAIMSELYNIICKSDQLKECMKLSAAKFISEDEEIGLCILYSYDYMHLTHKCVASYLENGTVLEEHYKQLKDVLIKL